MKQSIAAGLPMTLFGAVIVAISSTYPIGSLQRMGPGFLPLTCGVLLLLIGILIVVFDQSPDKTSKDTTLARPAIAVFAGLVAWALTVVPLGLIPATFLLVILVGYAQKNPSIVWSLVTAAVLSGFGTFIFIFGLHIRLKAFGI